MLTSEERAALRRMHQPFTPPGGDGPPGCSNGWCVGPWPCDVARLLDDLEAAERRATEYLEAARAISTRCDRHTGEQADLEDRLTAERDAARRWAALWKRAAKLRASVARQVQLGSHLATKAAERDAWKGRAERTERWSAAWKAVATRKRKALHHSGARMAMFRDRADMAEQLAYELGEDLRRYGAHLDTCAVAPCDCGLMAALGGEGPGC